MSRYRVYVPDPVIGSIGIIIPGSAIVGTPLDNGYVTVDYEGNKYGGHRSFDDMLLRAAYRHEVKYPTVARATLPENMLLAVGWYDYDLRHGNYVLTVEHPEQFAVWRAQMAVIE